MVSQTMAVSYTNSNMLVWYSNMSYSCHMLVRTLVYNIETDVVKKEIQWFTYLNNRRKDMTKTRGLNVIKILSGLLFTVLLEPFVWTSGSFPFTPSNTFKAERSPLGVIPTVHSLRKVSACLWVRSGITLVPYDWAEL